MPKRRDAIKTSIYRNQIVGRMPRGNKICQGDQKAAL